MRKIMNLSFRFIVFVFLSMQFNAAQAITVDFYDWVFNIDGTIHANFKLDPVTLYPDLDPVTWLPLPGDPLPTTGTLAGGLGTLSLGITGAGSHSVKSLLDYEILENTNTSYNESGSFNGMLAAGQSWEIDDPFFGDIYTNVISESKPLDGSSGVTTSNIDDVAIGLGWDFSLLAGDIATIDFVITDMMPTVDFYLSQFDHNSGESLYFYSSLNIQTSGGPAGPVDPPVSVPEPPVIYLILSALLFFLLKPGLILTRKPVVTGS